MQDTTDSGTPGAERHEHRYGAAEQQVVDLWLPRSGEARRTAVLVHGGFWRSGYDRSLMDPVATDLVGRGWAVWNVDYRGSGADGGGWPGTLDDVAAAVDALAGPAARHGLALSRTAFAGHSAGGHLALWAAARASLPEGAPGAVAAASAAVLPAAVACLAGVADLVLAHREHLGDGAVAALLGGGPAELPERYRAADPVQRVPVGVPLLVITGDADTTVPPDQAASFARAAQGAGDAVEHVVVPGEDHSAPIEPGSGCWRRTRDWLEAALPA